MPSPSPLQPNKDLNISASAWGSDAVKLAMGIRLRLMYGRRVLSENAKPGMQNGDESQAAEPSDGTRQPPVLSASKVTALCLFMDDCIDAILTSCI